MHGFGGRAHGHIGTFYVPKLISCGAGGTPATSFLTIRKIGASLGSRALRKSWKVFSLVEECPVDEGAWNGECAQKKLVGSPKAELDLNNPERGLPTDREASVRRVGRLEIKIAYRYA